MNRKSEEARECKREVEASARRIELLAEERKAAEQMLEQLRKTHRLEKKDRPILARNLGRMIELSARGETRTTGIMHKVFEVAFGQIGAESALKKRARWVRLEDEVLPRESLDSGEYAAQGKRFALLAKAFADAVHGADSEDAHLNAVLRLLKGSSLDRQQARRARTDVEGRETLSQAFDKIRDAVLREADLIDHFSAAARWPLVGYNLAEASRGLAIRPEFPALDPTKFVAGGPVWRLHPSLPRIPIGHIYHPLIARCVDLEQKLDPDACDQQAIFDLLIEAQTACSRVPRYADSNTLPQWSEESRFYIQRNIYERVIFRREEIHLTIAPDALLDDVNIGVHFVDDWNNMNLFIYAGTLIDQDHEIGLFGSDDGGDIIWCSRERGKTIVFEWSDPSAMFDPLAAATLLTDKDAAGQDLLLRPGSRFGIGITPDDVRSGRVPYLIRPSFADPANVLTPLPQTSLAGAIVRNLMAAAPEQRLDHLLAHQARKLTQMTESFLAEQRSAFDREWRR